MPRRPSTGWSGKTTRNLSRQFWPRSHARENKILAMRFGLDDGKPKTLEEIGAKLGVTRERIRQIQEEALNKMRVKISEHETPSVETAVMAA